MSKLETNTSACIGAGICANTAPNVFALDDDGLVVIKTIEVAPSDLDAAAAAVTICPAAALAWAPGAS